MTTAIKIIGRALRLCRVVDADEPLSANDAQDALDTLNAMLAEWHVAGIGLPDYQFDSLQSTIATDAADAEAIAYQLAIRVAPEYGSELSPAARASAEQAMGRLRLRYFQPGTVNFDELPRRTYAFNIVTGE